MHKKDKKQRNQLHKFAYFFLHNQQIQLLIFGEFYKQLFFVLLFYLYLSLANCIVLGDIQ